MPNWVYGMYAVKGTKQNMLNFLNEGIKNSGYAPKDDCQEAYDFLIANAKRKTSDFHYTDKDDRGCGTEADNPAQVYYEDALSMTTFRTIPDTFRQYDTTNYEKQMPEIARKQLEDYGCIGWYDWGLKYLGVKWDTELKDTTLEIDGDTAIMRFEMQTAWSVPSEWLHWVKQTFDVSVLLYADEEGGAFCFYGEIDGEDHDIEDVEVRPNENDFKSDEDFWEALSEWEDRAKEQMRDDFYNFVENFE